MVARAQAPVLAKKVAVTALGVVAPPPIHVESPAFRGSLALLFECVRDRKIELKDVPLAPICQAYFDYLVEQANPRLDEAAAALMALSYLLERKSWLLLPTNEPEPEEEDPMLLPEPTAHEYIEVIETLKLWQAERELHFFRPLDSGPDPYEVPATLGNVTSADLARALERLLRKAIPTPMDPLSKPRRSLSDQIGIVLRRLRPEFENLEQLLPTPFTREDAVYWFLSLLELIRLGQCRVKLGGEDVLFARGE